MRKAEWKGFTIGVLVTSLLTGGALAGSRTVPAELLYENIRIFMDGKELVPKDANGTTVEPFIIEGTTYVPIRAVSEAYDKDVIWKDESKEIHINEKPKQADKNGEKNEVLFTSIMLPGGQKAYPLLMRDVAVVDENGECYAAQTTLYRILSIAKYGHRIIDVTDNSYFDGFDEAIDFELGQKRFNIMGVEDSDGSIYDENEPAKKYLYAKEPKSGEHQSFSYNKRAYLSITDVLSFFDISYERVEYDSDTDNIIITLK